MPRHAPPYHRTRPTALAAALLASATGLTACAHRPADVPGTPRKELVRAVTQDHRLISFNAGQPGRLLSDLKLSGLASGETVMT